jgi:two-component system OmpR family response regulator
MSQRILVVDDEPHVTQVMKAFLSRAGFIVETAANGQAGLEVARAIRPAAVITDFEMPGMDGRQLIERLLADDEVRPSFIVLLTSRTDVELREWVERTNCVGLVEKPASPRRLVRYIEASLAAKPLEVA